MAATLLIALKVSIGLLIMGIGLGSKPADALYLWRRPGKLVRAVLAMYVLVPLAAFLLVRALPLTPGAQATLLVLAVSAGAPLLPRKLSRLDNDAYIYSLVVTSSLLAIVVVPAFVGLLSARFGVETNLPVAAAIAKTFLLPLGVGTALHALFPKFSVRAAGVIGTVGSVVLGVGALALVITNWSAFSGVRWEGIAVLVAMMLISLAIGHVLGGPSRDERTALAVSCSTRHVGIAIIVASAFAGPRTATIIGAYVIASVLVSIPYLKMQLRKGGAEAATPREGR